jgi:hypothetical protein
MEHTVNTGRTFACRDGCLHIAMAYHFLSQIAAVVRDGYTLF